VSKSAKIENHRPNWLSNCWSQNPSIRTRCDSTNSSTMLASSGNSRKVEPITLIVERKVHPNLGEKYYKICTRRKLWFNLCKNDGRKAQILYVGSKLLYEIHPWSGLYFSSNYLKNLSSHVKCRHASIFSLAMKKNCQFFASSIFISQEIFRQCEDTCSSFLPFTKYCKQDWSVDWTVLTLKIILSFLSDESD
jgi:hypothetical protein